MTHPDSLTGADVFDVPDRSLSPTDPAQVVPWLRGLPVGTILRDHLGAAWHLDDRPGGHPSTRAWLATGQGDIDADAYSMLVDAIKDLYGSPVFPLHWPAPTLVMMPQPLRNLLPRTSGTTEPSVAS